jgi:hypothetical protein
VLVKNDSASVKPKLRELKRFLISMFVSQLRWPRAQRRIGRRFIWRNVRQ